MNITLARHDTVPVLTLAGRFDGYGASVFDQQVEPLAHESTSWVLDFGAVQYISSMGIRSLLRAEKRLRQQHGSVVLVGLTPPIRQVLEMAGLLSHFRAAESVEGAVSLVRAETVAPDRTLQRMRGNRSCTFWPLNGNSVLEVWGSLAPVGTQARGTDVLHTFTLEISDLRSARVASAPHGHRLPGRPGHFSQRPPLPACFPRTGMASRTFCCRRNRRTHRCTSSPR